MERSGYHASIEDGVNEVFRQKPEWLPVAFEAMEKLNAGFYESRWVNAFVQQFYGKFDIVDGYLWACLWSDLILGKLLVSWVKIGHEPGPDKSEHNKQILGALKNHSFVHSATKTKVKMSATWVGSNNIGDGNFSWNGIMKFEQYQGSPDRVKYVNISSGSTMLEAGYTRLTTTTWHLNSSGHLARWPYGSTEIAVFVRPNKWRSPVVDSF